MARLTRSLLVLCWFALASATARAEVPESGAMEEGVNIEALKRQKRWAGAIAALGAAGLTVGTVGGLRQDDWGPAAARYTIIAGVSLPFATIAFGVWKVGEFELRSAVLALRGESQSVRQFRQRRQRRLVRAGWSLAAIGLVMGVTALADALRETRPRRVGLFALGPTGGALMVIGLPMAIRGHAMESSTLSMSVGLGRVSLSGTF
ncbi:MAG: hypothetical protein JJ863_34785 [Deltaproteobacteria bacterium]|nr:hypothetical protein [Deltaproteobacteria bacterium]